MGVGQDIDNKVCLVTGVASGIRTVAARQLAELEVVVIILGSSPCKCARQAVIIRGRDKCTD
jgi:NAD(P)-dependent dehydrogenase (short-subunit alcohol dehydrogenase family)